MKKIEIGKTWLVTYLTWVRKGKTQGKTCLFNNKCSQLFELYVQNKLDQFKSLISSWKDIFFYTSLLLFLYSEALERLDINLVLQLQNCSEKKC